jgi:hypothetical protein
MPRNKKCPLGNNLETLFTEYDDVPYDLGDENSRNEQLPDIVMIESKSSPIDLPPYYR